MFYQFCLQPAEAKLYSEEVARHQLRYVVFIGSQRCKPYLLAELSKASICKERHVAQ